MTIGNKPSDLHPDALTEVVDGVTVEKIRGAGSMWLASRISRYLGPFTDDNRLGIVVIAGAFVLEADGQLMRRPDVAFVSAERWPVDVNPPLDSDWSLVPDLTIEVPSPGEKAGAVAAKVREYLRYGVREVWIVYPLTSEVYVYDAVGSFRVVGLAGTLETPLVPGWRLPLTTLFRTPAPSV